MIDLSGGQPDLTPEWIPWMMECLSDKGLNKKVYYGQMIILAMTICGRICPKVRSI